jgi:transposase
LSLEYERAKYLMVFTMTVFLRLPARRRARRYHLAKIKAARKGHVRLESTDHTSRFMLFRTRDLLVRQRTQTINALRGTGASTHGNPKSKN